MSTDTDKGAPAPARPWAICDDEQADYAGWCGEQWFAGRTVYSISQGVVVAHCATEDIARYVLDGAALMQETAHV